MKQIQIFFWLACNAAILSCEGLPPLSSQENYQKNIQTIKINNKIESKMLKYWTYFPDRFALKVNGTTIQSGSSLSIPLNNNKLTVRYDYSFANGFRAGAKEITFEITNPQKKEYDIHFSWNDKYRVIVDGAKPCKTVKI